MHDDKNQGKQCGFQVILESLHTREKSERRGFGVRYYIHVIHDILLFLPAKSTLITIFHQVRIINKRKGEIRNM